MSGQPDRREIRSARLPPFAQAQIQPFPLLGF